MSGTTQSNFNVIVRVLDQTTAPLRAIADKVGKVTGAVESGSRRIITSAQPLAQGSLFGALSASAQSAFASVGALSGQLGAVVAPLAALSGLAGLGGLVATLNSAADRAQVLARAWQSIGINTDAQRGVFEDLRYAATQAGLEVSTAGAAMDTLTRTIAGAARGDNQDAAGLFARLGISLRDANGQIRSAVDLLPQLQRSFQRNTNPAVRAAMSNALFGSAEMGGVVAGLDEAAARRRERGIGGPGADQVRELTQFRQSWLDLGAAIQGGQDTIGAQLAPIMRPIVDAMREWVTQNREWIASKFTDAVKLLRDTIQDWPWERILGYWRQFKERLDEAVAAIGGTRSALIILGVILAGPIVAAFVSATAAVGAFTAGLLLNPVTASIGLIAGAAYLLYTNWEQVKDSLAAAWEMSHIRRFYSFIADTLIPSVVWLAIEGPGKLREAWDAVAGFFRSIADAIAGAFNTVKEAIDAVVSALQTAVEWLTRWESGQGATPEGRQQGGRNFGNRGRLGGFPVPDGLYQPQSYSPGAGDGSVQMLIRFENAPAGLQVQSQAAGVVSTPRVDVGYAFAGTSLARA